MRSSGSNPSRQDEAAEWFAALRAGAMLAEQRAAFDIWRADPRNQAALDAMHELWGELAILKDARPARASTRPSRMVAAAALLFVVLGAAGGASWFMLKGDTTIQTMAGEQRTQALPDGSVIAINVVSQISYAMGEDRRVVKISDGEAAFTVKADPERPFVVQTGDYEVRATGTVFNVRRREGAIEVAVSEGKVEICAAFGKNAGIPFASLAAGQLLRLPADLHGGAPESVTPVAVPAAQVSEWRMRVVTYEDAPIREVVTDFNRYFEQKLLVQPDLADQRVTIRLQVDDRERAIETLASLLNVGVRQTPRGEALTR